MARETPVFVSYARVDERYATELMSRLAKEPDIAPWQDRISMSPGDFEDQIKAGIESSDYLVLVMTPAAMRSPWVEKEWRYAREQGRCIVPIKPTFESAATEQEFEELRGHLPIWMQKIQTYDFDRYWRRFVAVLQNPCQATRSPFLAANLPSNFVDRPALFHRIIDSVLDADHKNPGGETVVLHGTGGLGKTTLALSVCHDPDVFAAFDGGVLWVTLGEQPQIGIELERIYSALTGERPGFKSQDEAMFEVAKKLDGKRCLVVIDDVWSFQHLKPFLHGSAYSSRLVTSRIFSVAVSAAPDERYRINVMEPDANEADRILSAGLSVPDGSLGRLRVLANRLKRVPLLLQLGNRTLVQQCALGQTVDDALEWALQQYRDLGVVAFDEKNAKERHDAVGNTVEVSLGFLADERRRCLELGVLHEDTDIPFSVLGALWTLKETQVQALAQRLHDFGVVKLNLPARSVRLHDYIREYLEGILPDRALVHGRLVDAWIKGRQPPAGYAVQHIVFHLVESLADTSRVVERGRQLIALLSDKRFEEYLRQHGDATALDLGLTLAIRRASESRAKEIPALIASLVLHRKSYASKARNAALVFEAAAQGKITDAAELLALFEIDRQWNTLARLLIAWVSPPDKAADAKAFVDDTENSCDCLLLKRVLAWVRHSPAGVPEGLREKSGGPDLRYVSAILQRAGGAEKLEGLEPLNYEDLVSGTDATGFIAERDGPDLVAFSRLDPKANTQYLERYIEIHAANRYAHYRNRSLWMLLGPILEVPDPPWVRALVQRIVTGALTVTAVDFEEALPLAIRGVRAHEGEASAATVLDDIHLQLIRDAETLEPHEGRTDSWSHYHRRAAALAEIFAIARGHCTEAAALLSLARDLPKGFAGFRSLSALTLAESTLIASPSDRAARDAALTSARAASHRIQDHRFCLQVTAMVNAVCSRWLDIAASELEATVDRFLDQPLEDEFCAVHRVLEEFEYRAQDQHAFQALPIPDEVRHARTLREIAEAFDYDLGDIVKVNGWVWGDPDSALEKDAEVNVPDPEFTPILAARFGAEALVADGLSSETRSWILQRLVPMALSNPTALDSVLGRLMLSTIERPAPLPPLLRDLELPHPEYGAGLAEDPTRLGPT
jgi:hypothetical protein